MDQQIKERMVGAGVLVLAAVIFIPMLLAGPPTQRAGSSARTGGEPVDSPNPGMGQSAAESGFSSRIVPLGEAVSGQSNAREVAREATPLPSSATPVAESSPARIAKASSSTKPKSAPKLSANSQPKPRPKAKPKSSPSPKPKPQVTAKGVRKAIVAPSTTTAVDGWVVQLGSFASSRNAHALRDRLKAKGYKVFARSSGSGAQAVTRIYIGPDASRERAEKRVNQLLAETRLKGIVIRNPK